jgi:hypothetical protein
MRLSQIVKASKVEAAGKPVGKAQKAIMDYFARSPDLKGWVDLSEVVKYNPAVRGVDYGRIMSACQALAKKGLIEYDDSKMALRKA